MPEDKEIRPSPQALRGLAHPLRVRLLNLLRADGPSTATRLAERTGQSSGATSYHLRQLAAYGFVVEDESHLGGRERWWRAGSRSTVLEADDFRKAPAETEAYVRAVTAYYVDQIDRWLNEMTTLPQEWDDAATLSDFRLRLRPEEATQLLADLEAVVARYRKDQPDADRPEGAERVVLQLQLMPFLRPTEPRDEPPAGSPRESVAEASAGDHQ